MDLKVTLIHQRLLISVCPPRFVSLGCPRFLFLASVVLLFFFLAFKRYYLKKDIIPSTLDGVSGGPCPGTRIPLGKLFVLCHPNKV